MTDFTNSEFKLAMFICRKTFGYHKERHKMSYSYIEQGTGMCRESISKAAFGLDIKGFLIKTANGHSFDFQINIDWNSSENRLLEESQQFGNQTANSSETRLLTVRKPNTIKETTKEKIKQIPSGDDFFEFLIPEQLVKDAEFMEAWRTWVSYRKSIKKKLVELSAKMQLKKMGVWGKAASIAAINRSIESGWKSVFPEQAKLTNERKKSKGYLEGW